MLRHLQSWFCRLEGPAAGALRQQLENGECLRGFASRALQGSCGE